MESIKNYEAMSAGFPLLLTAGPPPRGQGLQEEGEASSVLTDGFVVSRKI